VTPTEKGKRADALNQGPDTRRVLCEMVANREGDIDDLRADNDGLRKLVRDMWRTMGLLNACDVSEYDEPLNCIYCEQWGNVGKNIVGCKLMYRMDELRIETD